MGTTLARRIRRIGLFRTLVHETRLVTDEQGKEIELDVQVPVTKREKMTIEELTSRRDTMIAEWRAKRKKKAA
jgi:hypothetical protein